MNTKQEIIDLSREYHNSHGVTLQDVQKGLELQRIIESREKVPTPGDIIICKGPKQTYSKGHLEKAPEEFSSICTEPYVPFVSKDGESDISFSTSGGYWLSAPEKELIYKGKEKKIFRTWGHCGPCGHGSFKFEASVNVWELFLESIY